LVLPEEILRGHQDGAEALPIFAEPPSVDGVVWNYRRKSRFFPGLPDVQQGPAERPVQLGGIVWDRRKTSRENRTEHKCCRFFPASRTSSKAQQNHPFSLTACLVHQDVKGGGQSPWHTPCIRPHRHLLR